MKPRSQRYLAVAVLSSLVVGGDARGKRQPTVDRIWATLVARVTSLSGEALPNVVLSAQLRHGPLLIAVADVRSDEAGELRVEHLPPGAYEIALRRPDLRTQRVKLDTVPGSNVLPPQRMGPGQWLRGRVLDAGGNPVAGATVRVAPAVNESVEADEARTGGHGRFSLSGLGSGPHMVRVVAEGYVSSAEALVVLPTNDPVIVHLVKLVRLVGLLRGKGRGRAQIVVSRGGQQIAFTGADEVGRFAVGGLPPGPLEIRAYTDSNPWFASPVREVLLRGEQEVEIDLQPAMRISGYVRQVLSQSSDKVGPAVPGARLTLQPESATLADVTARTDAHGWFAFPAVVPGRYRVQAWAKGLLPVAALTVHVPLKRPLEISLPRGVVLEGRLVDRRGDAVVGALVQALMRSIPGGVERRVGELGVLPGPVPPIPTRLVSASAWPSLVASDFWSSTTDARGRFRLEGLPDHGLGLLLSHEDHGSLEVERVTFDGRSSDTGVRVSRQTCDGTTGGAHRAVIRIKVCWATRSPDGLTYSLGRIVLPAVTRVRLRVVDERGFAVPGAYVELTSGGGFFRQTRSDAYGEAVLSCPAGGTATVVVRAAWLQPATETLQLLAGDRPVVQIALQASAGTISGTTVDPYGMPIEGAEVEIVGVSPPIGAQSRRDGSFRLNQLPAGPLELRVRAPGYLSTAQAARAGEVLRIALRRPGVLKGRVTDWRTGGPIARFRLFLDRESERDVRDANGEFSLAAAPGAHQLVIRAEGYASLRRHVSVGGDDDVARAPVVDVRLLRAATLSGRVIDERGEPIVEASVSCAGLSTLTNERGAFELADVAEGAQEVTVRARGAAQRSWRVEVRSGTAAPLLLQIRGAAESGVE